MSGELGLYIRQEYKECVVDDMVWVMEVMTSVKVLLESLFELRGSLEARAKWGDKSINVTDNQVPLLPGPH